MTAIKKNSLSLLLALLLAALPAAAGAGEDEPADDALPVPRFVSLRSDEVNLRVGPGTRYSINWVYKREGLPVEVIHEFNQWREIRDAEGTTGWVHKQNLHGRRNAQVIGKIRSLRRAPSSDSATTLRLEPGVIGRLLECEKDWCRIQVAGRKGWIEKTAIFGAYAKEEF